ncbi:hypothetical protein COT49_02715 [candidate division WWE3 bacterium CG08_land_8_20_14_0_20_40_13]|uniref:Transposase IS200-like domain-containing protein n=1 Tax=candidate division WWE3 bacterium CG08_land_8_20_14_0_20_40_13 TaxID=1975084 RepID=A0A2H0XDU8_UNCKA|nr:MAG: hypothetical protein COT49_02715 [candidate division WWE3 bacterium CG08_land_8_20_14_0_20_40_13]
MPAINTVKHCFANGYYHIYNRGLNKSNIFLDDQDFVSFLHLLKLYLTPGLKVIRKDPRSKKPIEVTPNYCYSKIRLLSYCLMPNHFHLICQLLEVDGMKDFMRKISNQYTSVFNKRHEREGMVFGGIYRAVSIISADHLTKVAAYIHTNPYKIVKCGRVEDYQYSSLFHIHRNDTIPWINYDDVVLDRKGTKYTDFVKNCYNSKVFDGIHSLLIDDSD